MRNQIMSVLPAAAFLLLCFSPGAVAQTDEDWDWLNEHFPAVLDEFLQRPKSAVVSWRVNRDLYTEELEYSIAVVRNDKGGVDAIVKMADGVSLYDQLKFLRLREPSITIEAAKQRLRAKTWRLKEGDCLGIKAQFAEFEKLYIPAKLTEDLIILHPDVYSFWVSGSVGDMTITLTDLDHPLVIWADQTRLTLEGCIAGMQQ